MPAELVEAFANSCDPDSLFTLGNTCRHMQDIASSLWLARTIQYLGRFGFQLPSHPSLPSGPIHFLRRMTRVYGLIAGPGLLEILHPSSVAGLQAAGFYNRLEMHIPGTYDAVEVAEEELTSAGYHLQQVAVSPRAVNRFADLVLGYSQYGRTLQRIYHWARTLENGICQECVVFVGESFYSGLPSVLEEPCTLFMNYIYNGKIHVLYPDLTFARQGLINRTTFGLQLDDNDCWDEGWFKKPLSVSGFDIVESLDQLEDHVNHRCYHDSSCPSRNRTEMDGCNRVIPFYNFGLEPIHVPSGLLRGFT
ncbi:hypothetical protein NMY22_g4639 [Coprinellus aureogranulatus]|nr:hypothetical protein NMY22_g4639 [Coprinellus aureogranulatus]